MTRRLSLGITFRLSGPRPKYSLRLFSAYERRDDSGTARANLALVGLMSHPDTGHPALRGLFDAGSHQVEDAPEGSLVTHINGENAGQYHQNALCDPRDDGPMPYSS